MLNIHLATPNCKVIEASTDKNFQSNYKSKFCLAILLGYHYYWSACMIAIARPKAPFTVRNFKHDHVTYLLAMATVFHFKE